VSQPFFSAPLKSAEPLSVVGIDTLVRFFAQPSAALLRNRLGLRFFREEEVPDEREPMQKGRREDRAILETVVARCIDTDRPEALRRHCKAWGLLPLGLAGDVRFENLMAEASPILQAAMRERDGRPIEPVVVDLPVTSDIGDVRIVGVLDRIWPRGQVDFGYAYLSGTRLIKLWIRHLALTALTRDELPARSVAIGRKRGGGADRLVFTEPPTDPLLLLGDLVTLLHVGTERPLHLIPRFSYDYAAALEKNQDPVVAGARIRAEWPRGYEASDMAVRTAFRGADPLGPDTLGGVLSHSLGFENLAERVFFPLLDTIEKGAI
jgi:exodeoxyribonuclease V gamma subunit